MKTKINLIIATVAIIANILATSILYVDSHFQKKDFIDLEKKVSILESKLSVTKTELFQLMANDVLNYLPFAEIVQSVARDELNNLPFIDKNKIMKGIDHEK